MGVSSNVIIGIISIVYLVALVWFTYRGFAEVKDLKEFTTSGHRLGLLFTVAAFVATWISASSVTGIPSMLFMRGMPTVTGWFAGWFWATALMVVIAYKIRYPEHPSRTLPEYFKLRYEPHVKRSGLQVIAAIAMVIAYIAYIILQIKAVGMIISSVTGVSYTLAVFFFLIFLFYTASGGMWTVAWGDLVNTGMIIIGLFIGGYIVLDLVGGWQIMWQKISFMTAPPVTTAKPIAPGAMLDPIGSFGGTTLLGIFLANFLGGAVGPHHTARMMGSRNIKTAMLMAVYGLGLIFICFIPILILGLGGRALIGTMPAGKGSDWLIPLLLTQYINPFIAGIILAAILAAALSTANAMLLHNALAITYDIWRNISKKTIEEHKFMNVTRVVILVTGVLLTIAAIWPPEFIAILAAWAHGVWAATFFVPVLFGLYWKRMNRQAAYASSVIGLISFILIHEIWKNILNIPAIVWGVGLAVIAAILCSYIFPHAPKECWEPYFVPEPSNETKEAWRNAFKDHK